MQYCVMTPVDEKQMLEKYGSFSKPHPSATLHVSLGSQKYVEISVGAK